MTNEELAVQIQRGRTDLYGQLWDQVRRFIVKQARRRYVQTDGLGGVDVDDLTQSGFFAVVEAVRRFEPGRGCFLDILELCLRSVFSEAGGYKTTRRDPMLRYKSLDEPIDGDDPDGTTFLDTIKDPCANYEDAEQKIFIGQLRRVLDQSISELPIRQNEILYRHYVRGETLKEIGEDFGVTIERVRQMETGALRELNRRSRKNGLQQFVDRNTNFYRHVGLGVFNTTHTSAVELLAMQRERLERMYLHDHPEEQSSDGWRKDFHERTNTHESDPGKMP